MVDDLNSNKPSELPIRRSFRWRLIPATFFFLMGAASILGAVVMVSMAIFVNLRYGWIVPHPDTPTRNQAALTLENLTRWQINFWFGVGAIGAAISWLRGRWRSAWALTGLLWLMMVLLPAFFPALTE